MKKFNSSGLLPWWFFSMLTIKTWCGDVAPFVNSLICKHTDAGLTLSTLLKSWTWWPSTCNPSTGEVDTGSLLVSQPCLLAELWFSNRHGHKKFLLLRNDTQSYPVLHRNTQTNKYTHMHIHLCTQTNMQVHIHVYIRTKTKKLHFFPEHLSIWCFWASLSLVSHRDLCCAKGGRKVFSYCEDSSRAGEGALTEGDHWTKLIPEIIKRTLSLL